MCYNGILGDYGSNQCTVEIQLTRKFTSSQYVNDLPLPVAFQSIFKLLLNRLDSKQSGSLPDRSLSEKDHMSQDLIQCSLLSTGLIKTSGEFVKSVHMLWAMLKRFHRCRHASLSEKVLYYDP